MMVKNIMNVNFTHLGLNRDAVENQHLIKLESVVKIDDDYLIDIAVDDT